jgi:hypothetical protein
MAECTIYIVSHGEKNKGLGDCLHIIIMQHTRIPGVTTIVGVVTLLVRSRFLFARWSAFKEDAVDGSLIP